MQKLIVVLLLSVCVTYFGTGNTLDEMLADEELTDRELYTWLNQGGMRDASVPNGAIHKLVMAGLQHEDPEIQHCTLSAIRGHVGAYVGGITENRTITIDRRLQDIPQLYDLLMDMWDEELSKAGGIVPEIDYDITLEQLETGFPCEGGRPAWAGLQFTFAYLYPRNEKVYEMIWSTLEGKKTRPNRKRDNPIPLLVALHVGEFDNPKDQEFRIKILTGSETSIYTMGIAANSLAKYQSEEGLAALVDVLENQKSKNGFAPIEVVEAIMAHGEEATIKHRTLLAESMPKVFKNRADTTSALWIERELSQLKKEIEKPSEPSR